MRRLSRRGSARATFDPMPPSEQRWIVDAVAEGVARVEVDGERVLSVPAWLLPAGVREGDVLRVTRQRERGRAVVTLERDAAATGAARSAAEARAARRAAPPAGEPGPDATGDIEL
jgi:hypothetical protein